MRSLRTILLALVVVGCNHEDAGVASDPATSEVSAPFVAGERHRYRFAWNVATQAHDAWRIEGATVSAGIDMAGLLDVRVLGASADGWVLRCSFVELDRHTLSSFGVDALAGDDALRQLVGHDAWLVVDPNGARAPVVRFDERSPSVFRHLMGGLLVHLDLTAQRGRSREAVVPVGHGLAEVAYASHDRSATRTIRALARFDGLSGTTDVDRVEGEATIAFDEHRLPARIDAHERVAADGTADRPEYASETTVSFERDAFELAGEASIPALADKPARDLGSAPDDTESRRELARRFAEGLTMAELEIEVATVGAGLRAERGFLVRATGLLQSEPELALDVGALMLGTDSARSRLFALDLLTSAGTAEAQAVIVDALQREDLQADDDYPAMLQRLSLLPRPAAATVRFAIELHDRTEDPRTRNAVAYPLGALARRIADDDPATSALVRERLRDHLELAADDAARVAALAGLGNAGADEDLDLVLAHVDDDSDAVRMQVASSLRYYDAAPARAAMLALVADDAVPVATLALTTLDTFALGDEDLRAFGHLIMGGETSPEVTTSVINVLARHRERSATLEGALWVLLGRETDFRRKLRLERLLGLRA